MNEVLDKKKLERILQRVVDVLRINIFIVDEEGRAMVMPRLEGCGWKLWANTAVGSDILGGQKTKWMKKFRKQGQYWEYKDDFGLHSFVLPVEVAEKGAVGCMIVGPIILNQRLSNIEYRKIALKLDLNSDDLTDLISEIRVISFLDLKSILDLLMDIFPYTLELSYQLSQRLQKSRLEHDSTASGSVSNNFSSGYMQGLLEAFLDTALTLTKAECGSIMIQDSESGDLRIQISRGLHADQVRETRMKIGEGIAGLAFKEESPFLINERHHADSRIKHLLKRSDIKHSLVLPLRSDGQVFGVLNIHTKKRENRIEEDSLLMVQNLSRLASAALDSFPKKAA